MLKLAFKFYEMDPWYFLEPEKSAYLKWFELFLFRKRERVCGFQYHFKKGYPTIVNRTDYLLGN